MEEILKQLLEGQKQLFEGQKQLFNRLDKIDARLDKMDARFDKMDARLDKMDARLDSIDTRLGNVEGQLEENTAILRALEHASEVLKAETEALKFAVARVEGEVKGLRNDLNTVEMVTAKNWNDIIHLKAVK